MILLPLLSSSLTCLVYSRVLSKLEFAYCAALIGIGVFGGVLSTYTAMRNLVHTTFAMPCYLSSSASTN